MKIGKTIYVDGGPLPICGHDYIGTKNGSMIGREEHFFLINGKKYTYTASVEQFGCKICSKKAMDKVKRKIKYLMKKYGDEPLSNPRETWSIKKPKGAYINLQKKYHKRLVRKMEEMEKNSRISPAMRGEPITITGDKKSMDTFRRILKHSEENRQLRKSIITAIKAVPFGEPFKPLNKNTRYGHNEIRGI
jgi:hypothetical protein